MVISRWRACASHGWTPLLTTLMQNWPSLIAVLPAAGTVNDDVQGMYLPPSNVVLARRSLPESLGASTPCDPFVGAAFQSAGVPAAAGADGTAAAGPIVSGAVAAAGAIGAVAGAAAPDVVAGPAHAANPEIRSRETARSQTGARRSVIGNPRG